MGNNGYKNQALDTHLQLGSIETNQEGPGKAEESGVCDDGLNFAKISVIMSV